MIFEVDSRNQSVTAATVTLTVDAETCLMLSQVFGDLADALERAQRAHKSRKRYEADRPAREAKSRALRATIGQRVEALEARGLPLREIIKTLRVELNKDWDTMDYLVRDIRRGQRQAALAGRDGEIMWLSKSGATAMAIAGRLGLAQGTVRNILSRLRGTSGRRAALKSQAA